MENSKEKKIKIPEVATVNHAHHRQRLYARIAEVGLERCDDLTILEFILTLAIPRVDTNPIAHRLMDRFGSISAVLDASPLQLQEIRGIGPRAARLLSFFPQLCNCYNKDKVKNTKLILTKGQAIKYCSALLKNKNQEEFYAICLDKSNKVLAVIPISRGDETTVSFKKQDILSKIIMVSNTNQVLLTHSHPNSTPYPSVNDDKTTQELTESFKYFGLELYDHIIVGLTHSYSCVEGRLYENT
ncbi:MAG: RadC family protein [Clostridia bacterium]|nr:RadC family protein [Clostridia bacterium]